MANRVNVEKYRTRLETLRDELRGLSDTAADSREPVELDQSRVGRLSRPAAGGSGPRCGHFGGARRRKPAGPRIPRCVGPPRRGQERARGTSAGKPRVRRVSGPQGPAARLRSCQTQAQELGVFPLPRTLRANCTDKPRLDSRFKGLAGLQRVARPRRGPHRALLSHPLAAVAGSMWTCQRGYQTA